LEPSWPRGSLCNSEHGSRRRLGRSSFARGFCTPRAKCAWRSGFTEFCTGVFARDCCKSLQRCGFHFVCCDGDPNPTCKNSEYCAPRVGLRPRILGYFVDRRAHNRGEFKHKDAR
jgi:hypothetical protein